MLMSVETYNEMNLLLQKCFDMNAFCDNCAYNMSTNYYDEMENIFHNNFAHLWTSDKFADGISSKMLELNARPVRLAITETYNKQYGDLKELFADVLNKTSALRDYVIELIDNTDARGDYEIKIFCESLLEGIINRCVKQAHE